jgi:hypothetical protein
VHLAALDVPFSVAYLSIEKDYGASRTKHCNFGSRKCDFRSFDTMFMVDMPNRLAP